MYQASYNIDMIKLEAEVVKFLERVSPDDQISVAYLYKALEESDDKPGLDLVTEGEKRESYVTDLKEKFSKRIEANKGGDCSIVPKREVKALMIRHLLGLATKTRNSEFDFLVTLKVNRWKRDLFDRIQYCLGHCYCSPAGGEDLSSGH